MRVDVYASVRPAIDPRTGDAEGDVIEQREVPNLTEEQLQAILQQFKGKISQIPSMYSALKHNGKPLYELARQGIEVERPAREIFIYQNDLTEQTADTFSLYVRCSKGTYIRNLVEDIGEAIGCGAHVIALHRDTVSDLGDETMYSLDELQALHDSCRDQDDFTALNELLLPLDKMVSHWPEIKLSKTTAYYLKQGQSVRVPNLGQPGWVRIYQENETFLGVGEVSEEGKLAPRRMVAKGLVSTAEAG